LTGAGFNLKQTYTFSLSFKTIFALPVIHHHNPNEFV